MGERQKEERRKSLLRIRKKRGRLHVHTPQIHPGVANLPVSAVVCGRRASGLCLE